jgi:hypothetical protein
MGLGGDGDGAFQCAQGFTPGCHGAAWGRRWINYSHYKAGRHRSAGEQYGVSGRPADHQAGARLARRRAAGTAGPLLSARPPGTVTTGVAQGRRSVSDPAWEAANTLTGLRSRSRARDTGEGEPQVCCAWATPLLVKRGCEGGGRSAVDRLSPRSIEHPFEGSVKPPRLPPRGSGDLESFDVFVEQTESGSRAGRTGNGARFLRFMSSDPMPVDPWVLLFID